MKTIRFSVLSLLASILLSLSSCSDKAVSPTQTVTDPNAVKIPKLLSLTGKHATYNLSYNGDTLKQIRGVKSTTPYQGSNLQWDYEYRTHNGKAVLSLIRYNTLNDIAISSYDSQSRPAVVDSRTITYDEQGRVSRIATSENQYSRYEYQGENLKKIYVKEPYGQPESVFFEAMAFDDKINIYRSFPVATLHRMITSRAYHNEFSEWYTNMPLGVLSKNNVTSFKIYNTNGSVHTGTIAYTYSAANLPLTMATSIVIPASGSTQAETLLYNHTLTYASN